MAQGRHLRQLKPPQRKCSTGRSECCSFHPLLFVLYFYFQVKQTQIHKKLLAAQKKADDSTIKLDIVRFFKENYNRKFEFLFLSLNNRHIIHVCFSLVAVNAKLVQTMDPLHLELSYQMALLDKRFHLASLTIAAAYRGLRTRRHLRKILANRKWAVLTIQRIMRKLMADQRLKRDKITATLLVQRYCRGHLVSKRWIQKVGDIRIDATLKQFYDIKKHNELSIRYLLWYIYKKYKKRKEKKKKKKGKKGKKGKGVKKSSSSASNTTSMQSTLGRANSLSTAKTTVPPKLGKTMSKPDAKSLTMATPKKTPSVMAQDKEGTVDLTTPDGAASFSLTSADKARRETMVPTHNMEKIDEGDDEEREIKEEENEDEEGGERSPEQQESPDAPDSPVSPEGVADGDNTLSKSEFLKLHEVSILDLDKEGSLNLDQSDEERKGETRQKL